MTLRTITFDDAEWQVVPKNPVPAMIESGANEVIAPLPTAGAKAGAVYIAMLAAVPGPPTQQPMTHKQAYAIAEEFWDEYGIPRQQTLRVIRDTERHHGIGKGESNED